MIRAVKMALGPVARGVSAHRGRILMYHRFGTTTSARHLDQADLEKQLLHLLRHYSVLPLRDIADCLRQGRPLPPRSVALTVDDGYADFADVAYPVFSRLRVPVTLYVTSHFIDGRIWLWWDAIRYLVHRAGSGAFDFPFGDQPLQLQLDSECNRDLAWNALADVGVRLDPQCREQMIAHLQQILGVSLPPTPTPEFAASSWTQLKAFDPSVVEIGAHTQTHPILSRCDTDRIRDEVFGSKAHIESALGRRVISFCYPNGQPDDVDERCVQAVRDAGYESAVIACGGYLGPQSNIFALERMPARHDILDFCSAVDGVPDLFRGTDSAPRRLPFQY